ncbi:chloride channel, nucleotide-sensitive, 1A [Marchantia polymorpha subsp. ruderalis]|uniref:Chloride conductance regulatory protein ICln n=2 Tax=Marchantia polymorpha TaxID=3197 RepID=A0AAF6ALH2_MARPO|nr:hypothetical protein MARPO_0005s0155 [Marchantia polymorpha]BBM97292.1 hypothetical protein Mp_1g04520 [Marchantia polymorpha subsp. ruderalis]|eukprot:PTQ48515.1 hypothetical protein MARPO_0005s0155 [Marchantia polymorpha]
MATGLVAITERAADGGPLLNTGEDESIAHVAPDVGIVLEEGPVQQNGTLYITTKRLIWLSNDNLQKGYAVSFLSLSMHAISRNPNAYPVPCIYTQIESGDSDSEYEEADDMEDSLEAECDEEEDLSKVEEMRLVPRDPDILDQIFQVLCDCALLNPDPTGEQEGEGEWYFNVNEVLGGRPIGEDDDKPFDVTDISELHIHDPRFEDAEEELEEDGAA